jgi:diguanylate cyclase (GGDEF)-like protein
MLNRYPLDRNLKAFSRSRRKADAQASAKAALEIPADTIPFLAGSHHAKTVSSLNMSGSNMSGSDVPDLNQAHPPQPNPDESVHMLMRNDVSDGSGASGSVAEASMNRFHSSSRVISVDTYSNAWQMQQRNAQQQRLRQVERNLRKSLNLSAILGATVVESAALFQAQQVSLLRYCEDLQNWQSVAQYCCNQSLAWGRRISPDASEYSDLMAQIRQGNTVLLNANQLNDNQSLPTAETRQWLACWPGSWLLVPVQTIRATGQLLNPQFGYPPTNPLRHPLETEPKEANHWGILALALPDNTVWSADAVAGAQSIALELSLAMNHAQQHESLLVANQELQKLALSDGLTHLANRRRFDEHLADEWQRLARDQRPLSLILCDLDHFKRYNDTFGHPAGDRCLIRVARALLSGPQRPADLVARYGGEEFAIILPNTDTNGAWRIAQKIHNSIRALKIAHAADNEKPYVTVTMGVSTIIPGRETTAQVLLQAADLALYHAKQQGRDRTYVHAHYNTVSPTSDTSNPSDESQPVTMMTPSEDA